MEKKCLLECVASLKDVRRSMHSDTETSIATALDAVITKFEGCLNETDERTIAATAAEALAILSYLLTCCSSVADLVSRFRG